MIISVFCDSHLKSLPWRDPLVSRGNNLMFLNTGRFNCL